ncbi:hypothetical protein JANAI62_36740 [Jannaschia pagri]|uniref:Hemolysin-type calcium-binding repeat-containing protein n=1 Tax=Jannaschia pagri TaxID=2829797 RepID=A0ABQ4NRS4_9RHOB|nr:MULTISPECIES: calcium-binding protein [unclassified Jannaschia]GIT93182.1 hypothetical protein JANAI61_36400 [Jannaschia sp. AI_61]GIT97051.1 hypothetical protein JANAI62_36740 [Jannaschia sp. AI_62]
MTTTTTFTFEGDLLGSFEDDEFIRTLESGTVAITFPGEPSDTVRYNIENTFDFLPEVEFNPEEISLVLDGVDARDIEAQGLYIIDVEFGQLTWSGGVTYILNVLQAVPSDVVPTLDYFIDVAGAELPEFSNANEITNFFLANFDGFAPIPETDSFGPGRSFSFSDLRTTSVTVNAPPEPEGPTDGPDSLTGDDENNSIDALGGNDTVSGGGGNDTLLGREGDDILDGGDGVDAINGGPGEDTITGGVGNDSLLGDLDNDLIDGGNGADVARGGDGFDVITGGAGDDTLVGDAGNDTIAGNADNDVIFGGAGEDIIRGDDGDDSVRAELDDDTVLGGSGNDTLLGQDGSDQLLGEDGDDQIGGGAGNDDVQGGTGADTLFGGDGDDTLQGNDGADLITADAGEDSAEGGAGDDVIDGGSGGDTLLGGADNDSLSGGSGDDSLSGGEGNDTLQGDAGNDSLTGGLGDDLLVGGAGNDVLRGGVGSDVFIIEGRDTILEAVGDEGFDEVRTSSNFTSQAGIEQVTATGTGNIRLDGTGADEVLLGNSGSNILVGFGGEDTMTGGGGADTFVLTALGGTDPNVLITDWTAGDNRLAIDDQLLGIGAPGINIRDLTVQVFNDLLQSGSVGYSARTGRLLIDTDGDGDRELVATIEGGAVLGLEDVILF